MTNAVVKNNMSAINVLEDVIVKATLKTFNDDGSAADTIPAAINSVKLHNNGELWLTKYSYCDNIAYWNNVVVIKNVEENTLIQLLELEYSLEEIVSFFEKKGNEIIWDPYDPENDPFFI